jgi:hypothetical protein
MRKVNGCSQPVVADKKLKKANENNHNKYEVQLGNSNHIPFKDTNRTVISRLDGGFGMKIWGK